MHSDSEERSIAVLRHALESSSRVLRLRAVSMLARVECGERDAWLARALEDADEGVRDTAHAVACWVTEAVGQPWPDREDPMFDRVTGGADPEVELELSAALSWEWEYAIEVWRDDGLLIGVFLSTSCAEDDEHAKCIALGQAILANVRPSGDEFDPATAASFIVGKRRVPRQARAPRGPGDGRKGRP